jgi:hypothetical protein
MKRHHYNPQVYLRQFTRPNSKSELWEYDLTKGVAKQSTPKDSGYEDYYHSFVRSDGQRDDETIERSFSTIENRLPELFKAIRNRMPITDELLILFCWFAAIQRARSPRMLASSQRVLQNYHESTWEMLKQTPNFDSAMIARGQEPSKVRDAKFQITPNRGLSLRMLLDRSEKLVGCFQKMHWTFYCAPQGTFFFTNDDPVCCWSPSHECGRFDAVGPKSPDVDITFPLSRAVCAHGSWNPALPGFIELKSQEVNDINFRTIVSGWKFAFGPAKDNLILEWVTQHNPKSGSSGILRCFLIGVFKSF